jgi:hypothetical protein
MSFDVTNYVDNIEQKFRGEENKWLRVALKLQLKLEQALVIISDSDEAEFCEQFVTEQDKKIPKTCLQDHNMSYNDWDQNYSPADDEIVRPEQIKLDNASYWLESVLERLYDKESPLDSFSLQCDLDELCHQLGVKPRFSLIQIQRKENPESKVSEFLNGMEA